MGRGENYNLCYTIKRGYSKLIIYWSNKNTNRLVSTEWLVPDKDRSRKRKYEIIAKELKSHGVEPPEYKPTKKERL